MIGWDCESAWRSLEETQFFLDRIIQRRALVYNPFAFISFSWHLFLLHQQHKAHKASSMEGYVDADNGSFSKWLGKLQLLGRKKNALHAEKMVLITDS